MTELFKIILNDKSVPCQDGLQKCRNGALLRNKEQRAVQNDRYGKKAGDFLFLKRYNDYIFISLNKKAIIKRFIHPYVGVIFLYRK